VKIRIIHLTLSILLGNIVLPQIAAAQFGGFLKDATSAVKGKLDQATDKVSDVLDPDRAADAALITFGTLAQSALPAVDAHDYERALSVSDQMCTEIIEPFALSDNFSAIAEDVVIKEGAAILGNLATGGQATTTGDDLLIKAKTSAKQLNWLPMEQEIAYGQKIHDLVIANEKRAIIRTDKGRVEKLYAQADSLIARVMEQITEEHPYTFQILLIDNDDVNATALPGGFLHLNTGVLQSDHAELVLTHEIGHVFKRHQTRETQARLIDTVDSVDDLRQLLGMNTDVLDQSMERAAGLYGSFQNFSRQQELQADACAVRMTGRVPDIELDAMIDKYIESVSQTTVSAQAGTNQNGPEGILQDLPIKQQSGHPDYPERRQRMQEVAQQLATTQN
jgi:Zn-dependent protease with chaperone function